LDVGSGSERAGTAGEEMRRRLERVAGDG